MAKNLPLEHQAAVDPKTTEQQNPEWTRRTKKFFFPALGTTGVSIEAETLEEAQEKAKELFNK